MLNINQLVEQYYEIPVTEVSPILVGVGGETYLVKSNDKKYIVKLCEHDCMSHPEKEAIVCNKLRHTGIPVPEYIKTKNGEFYVNLHDENNRICHMQTYIEGDHYAEHTAPEWLMTESARVLGNIHKCLANEEDLPMGIGSVFFEHMTYETALASYTESLRIAKENKEPDIVKDIEDRIRIVKSMPEFKLDTNKLTYCNTHGDYTINQLICSENKIIGVVDWTTACKHPAVWEIVRSFLLAEVSSEDGYINIDKLNSYIKEYTAINPLSPYDYDHLLEVYIYQIAVCDYYAQYFQASHKNKAEYLQQAKFATNILRYFDAHRDELIKTI